MEIGPIFRALMHNKARFLLIVLEVALTLAIVSNCVNMILDYRGELLRPSGLDEQNLLVVTTSPFAQDFDAREFLKDVERADIERLRSIPGVREATAIHAIPMSGGGSATGRKPLGAETDTHGTPYFVVADRALQTLGVELVDGRDFQPGDFVFSEDGPEGRNVILTQELAEVLFPDGPAVNQQIENSSGEVVDTVVGVIQRMHNSWPRGSQRERVMLRPGQPGSQRRMRYMVRAQPGAVDTVYTALEEAVRDVHPGRVITVTTLIEEKRDYYSDSLVLVKLLTGVSVLLVLVTALGIIGLTSFSVTQRTRQIGTRRALGATKGDIVRYFLVENWLITGFGLVVGIGLGLALNMTLTHLADVPKMEWSLLAGGALTLWVTGILAALAPALRATQIAPEVATRSI